MRVRNYLIILLLGYSVCGLTVFFMLNAIHRGEAQLSDQVSESKLILRDIDGLERNFSHWMLLSDLVLGADESYLCNGALKLGNEVNSILQTLATEVNPAYQTSVLEIQDFSNRQKDRLLKSRSLVHSDRQSKLDELLTQMDADSEIAIGSLESLKTSILTVFEQQESQLDASLSNRQAAIRICLLGFLGSALLLWLWISSIVSQPISMLAQQSRIKDESERNFKLRATAPYEVRQLADSFSELVGDLEYQIEEHKKTQIERGKLHRKLMDASRRAGMADVASEVLHNVGNVLNSMNVSATVIRNSLRDSLVPKLVFANRQFLKHKDDYGHYLEKDEKGKHFPAALDYMSDTLVADRETYQEETKQLIKNIAHVRDAIRRQLSMSRDKGVIETFPLSELIHECISINKDKANRLNAFFSVECPETLNLVTDRHKLQQVLINLIANALDSVGEDLTESGRVKVIANHESEMVELSVVDNGVGIPEQNLTKVFQQGFTTKVKGHGFGLHSCALTAQALGGILNVTSDGPGHGSSFQLVIPLKQLELCTV